MATVERRQSTIFSRLRGLLEVTRLIRTGDDLPALLTAVARTVGESLGFGTVIINLYQREWDNFVVTTVYGGDENRTALLGRVREVADWEALLDPRNLQRGAYLVPNGTSDAIHIPMRGSNGALLGILCVLDPVSHRKPTGDELDVLVAVTEHAAAAVESAQETTRARANSEALQRLLEVSTRLNETADTDELLDLVCSAISEVLGFEKVAVWISDDDEHGTAIATAGFETNKSVDAELTPSELDRVLISEFEVGGCYVLTNDQALEILPPADRGNDYRSRLDGRGPHAWHNHWLLVPIANRRGERIGYLWADDPVDRLVPDEERLRILRAFTNQASTAIAQASQLTRLRRAEAQYASFVEQVPLATYVNTAGFPPRTTFASPQLETMLGYPAESWLEPDAFVSRLHPDDSDRVLAEIVRTRDTGEVFMLEYRLFAADGSTVWVADHSVVVYDADRQPILVQGFIVDVTENYERRRPGLRLAVS